MKSNRMSGKVWRTLATAAVAFCVLVGESARGEIVMGHRYEIVPWTQGTWTGAKADAESKGGHLATFTSETEWKAVFGRLGSDMIGCWLGGTDAGEEGVWRWITGEQWEYTRWHKAQPDNLRGNQHYLSLKPDYEGYWDDDSDPSGFGVTKYLLEYGVFNTDISIAPTARTFPRDGGSASIVTDGSGAWKAWTEAEWITLLQASGSAGSPCIFMVKVNLTEETRTAWIYVEDQAFLVTQTAGAMPVPTSRYEIIPWTNGWTAAKADAEARGGHLATITSEAEWIVISNLFGSNVSASWLGGTDEAQEGVWRWVTGEKWEYTRWCESEPNDAKGQEEYLVIWENSFGWNDVPDTYTSIKQYLLEYENYHNTNITVASIGRTFDKAGGAASVLTGGSGEWEAWTDSAWITLSRANGEAGVSCIYAVGANFSADTRMGRIYIEDKVFTVTQTGYEGAISPEGAEWDCAGAAGKSR